MPERMPRYRRRWLMRNVNVSRAGDALLMQRWNRRWKAPGGAVHQHHTTVALNLAPARELPDNRWRWWTSSRQMKRKLKS